MYFISQMGLLYEICRLDALPVKFRQQHYHTEMSFTECFFYIIQQSNQYVFKDTTSLVVQQQIYEEDFKKVKKLCVFTLYTEIGASSQYRAYAFRKELEKHFVVQWFPFWNDSCITKYMHNKKKYLFPLAFFYLCAVIKRVYQMLYIAPKSDVVFIQKACIPKIKEIGRAHV